MSEFDDPLEILLAAEGNEDEAELLHAQHHAEDCHTKPCSGSDNEGGFTPSATYFF